MHIRITLVNCQKCVIVSVHSWVGGVFARRRAAHHRQLCVHDRNTEAARHIVARGIRGRVDHGCVAKSKLGSRGVYDAGVLHIVVVRAVGDKHVGVCADSCVSGVRNGGGAI